MDAAMRDLERIHEQEPDEGAFRRAGVFVLAAVVTLLLVYAMGTLVTRDEPVSEPVDPLAALGASQPIAAEAEAAAITPPPPVVVDRESLVFPEVLVGDDRPEVGATLAAAAAERALLAPERHTLPATVAAAFLPSTPSTLPAAALATPERQEIARAAERDPLLAAALPAETTPRGSVGMDGRYTLQVVSYRAREEADAFAEALRTRGHDAFVLNAEVEGRGAFYRVRIGPFETPRDAEAYRRTFEEQERMNTFVVKRRADEEPPG